MPNMIDLIMGNTPVQRYDKERQKQETFFKEQLPELANRFYQTDPRDAEGHTRNALELMRATHSAGLGEKEFGTILNHLTAPARAKTAEHVYNEIDSGRKERGGRLVEENITGRAPLEGADDSLQAFRTQSDFNQDDALKLGRAEAMHGLKIPAHLAETLRVPSQVQAEGELARKRVAERSVERTKNRLLEMQEAALEGLGNSQGSGQQGGEIDIGTIAWATGGQGIVPHVKNERDRFQQQPVVDSTVGLNRARTTTEGSRQRELGTQSQYNVARTNKTNDRTRDFAPDGSGGAGSETTSETEGPVNSEEQFAVGRRIAATANERGTTDKASVRRIADEFGYELTGDASVEALKEPGALYGENVVKDKKTGRPIITLKGPFQLKRKPQTRTTRKGPAGAAAPSGAASSKEALLKKYGLD